MITAKEMYVNAEDHGACKEALEWLGSLPDDANPLDFEHENKVEWAWWYACEVIKGRWVETEPIIKTNSEIACWYARYVIKKRWVEAEPIILTDPDYACWYARYVIKRRWKEAEQIILTDPYLAQMYSKYVVNK